MLLKYYRKFMYQDLPKENILYNKNKCNLNISYYIVYLVSNT